MPQVVLPQNRYSLKYIKAYFKKKQKCACFGCKVELDINDFERLDIDARGAVWRRDDRDGRLLRLCGTDGSFGIA